jgi:hypothetical protein
MTKKFITIKISFILLFAICYLLSAAFPAFAQLDLPSFLNPFQQQTKSAMPAIDSSDLSLVWTTNTYTPPDYQGKALPAYGSVVEVSVIPNKSIKTGLASLVYNWYLDGQFKDSQSGKNRQKFTFRVSALGGQQHLAKLKLTTEDGQELFSLSSAINIVTPQIVLYPAETQTINFINAGASQTDMSPGQEKTFVALPYFFNISAPDALTYQWSFERQTINKIQDKNKFSVKVSSGELAESFSRQLSLLVFNPANEIQRATGLMTITIKK